MYRDILGLDEFFYSTTREEGVEVGIGFEQGAFAAGGTDIELASDDEWKRVAQGPVRGLGFQTDCIEGVYGVFRSRDVPCERPGNGAPFYPGRDTFALNSPDGLKLQIVA